MQGWPLTDSWLTGLSDEDAAFIKRFVLASGSLKELAKAYGIGQLAGSLSQELGVDLLTIRPARRRRRFGQRGCQQFRPGQQSNGRCIRRRWHET